jgi:DNA-binding winged helix-turn-helix (wHTH) protein
MELRFGDFVFDGESRRLARAGRPVHLEPKVFELLELLIERRPAAVSKSAIRDRLWSRTFVSESSLTTVVAQLRKALGGGDDPTGVIRTVHGFGYAFDADAVVGGAARATAQGGASGASNEEGPCLIWQGQVFALSQGENVLGRDPGVQILIDAPGVSRRHARVVLQGIEASVEDLGSKNGTFVGEDRVEGTSRLTDRDRLRLGRIVLVYRSLRQPGSTETELP